MPGKKKTKKRVTFIIEDDLDKKIRTAQAKMIQKENKSVSYSEVIGMFLNSVLKKS